MTWAYCRCGEGNWKPTLQYDLSFRVACWACDAALPRAQSTEAWLIELADEVAELRAEIAAMREAAALA